MQLRTALNHFELAPIHFGFSSCAAHLSSSGGSMYMSWSVSASVTSNELWPPSRPQLSPIVTKQPHESCRRTSTAPVRKHPCWTTCAMLSESRHAETKRQHGDNYQLHVCIIWSPLKWFSQQQYTMLVQCIFSPDLVHTVAIMHMVHMIIFHTGSQSFPLSLFSDQWAHFPSGLVLLITGLD